MRQLEVIVPVGSRATVFLPADSKAIRESGRRLKKGKGILSISEAADCVKVVVCQGKYTFILE